MKRIINQKIDEIKKISKIKDFNKEMEVIYTLLESTEAKENLTVDEVCDFRDVLIKVSSDFLRNFTYDESSKEEEKKEITKKPTYKKLASYLNVTESAVKQYSKKKRDLMILGLWQLANNEKN